MKNPVCLTLLSALAGMLTLHCTTWGTPQDASPFDQQPEGKVRPSVTYVQQEDPVAGVVRRFPRATTIRSKTHKLKTLMKQYKDAERDEKEDLETQIRTMLKDQYDSFLTQNEKQIEQLQERLNKLKDQLDRRRRAKNKMVDLEFERMANEADGLIWPDRNFGGGPAVWSTVPGRLGTAPAVVPAAPGLPGPSAVSPPGAVR